MKKDFEKIMNFLRTNINEKEFDYLYNAEKCPECKKKINSMITINKKEKCFYPNPDFLIHMHETHGYPPEIMIGIIANLIFKDSAKEWKNDFIEKYTKVIK